MPSDWRIGTAGEIIELHDAKRIPLSGAQRAKMEKLYPYYGATSLMDYVDNYLFDGVYLLLGEDGTVVDDKGFPILQYIDGKFWVNNHAHVLQALPKIADNQFLAYSINQANIESLLVGGGRAKLNAETLMEIELTIPSIEEQRTVGVYLQHFDNLITLHQREADECKRLKQALTQLLLTGIVRVNK